MRPVWNVMKWFLVAIGAIVAGYYLKQSGVFTGSQPSALDAELTAKALDGANKALRNTESYVNMIGVANVEESRWSLYASKRDSPGELDYIAGSYDAKIAARPVETLGLLSNREAA
jgi:hypothetical protein